MANGNSKGWWAPFYERMLDGDIYPDAKLYQVWSWILMRAKPWPRQDTTRRGIVELGPGEILLNIDQLAKRIGVSATTYRRLLDKLVSRGSITKETLLDGVKVKVVNVDKYWLYKSNGHGVEVQPEVQPEAALDDLTYREETVYGDAPEKSGGSTGGSTGGLLGQNGGSELEEMLAKVEGVDPGRNTNSERTSGDGVQKTGGLISAAESPKAEARTEEEEDSSLDLSSVVSIPPVDCTKGVSSVVVPPTPARARKKQLDLIPKEPEVEPEDHADVLRISRAFEAIEAPLWNEIKSDIRWIRHTLKANRDWIRVTKWGELGVVAMVEYCINMAYGWWVGHPKDRWKNVRAGVTRWINKERQDLMGAGRGNGRAQSYPVPTEPGKYDGIGVVNSEFDLS